jgi:uncharacterized membrane protein HdeD (DUF308 family)
MTTTGKFEAGTFRDNGWIVVWGVLLIISGVLAVLMPVIAALATALFLGWLLVLSAAFEITHAFQTRTRRGFGWKLCSGLLTFALGITILIMPLAGVASLALLVGSFLLLGGVVRSILALQFHQLPRWGWVLLDGLLSILLAILILIGWPQSSVAFIGLLTGFSLIFNGAWRIALGRHMHS